MKYKAVPNILKTKYCSEMSNDSKVNGIKIVIWYNSFQYILVLQVSSHVYYDY